MRISRAAAKQIVEEFYITPEMEQTSSISSMAGWTGVVSDLCTFLGKPVIALAVGTIFAVVQLAGAKKMDKFYDITNDTLKTVGPILFVTAAGGVLGKVISSSDMVNYITGHAEALKSIGIFFPFLLAAILKSAQGSSIVAITTTAGILAPLMGALGLDTPAGLRPLPVLNEKECETHGQNIAR